jgi:hypothetical protein
MDDQLRQTYRIANKKRELSEALDRLQKHFKMPRCVITNRAQTLGLRYVQWRIWSEDEIEFLREFGGSMSSAKIAVKLHRSPSAVRQRLFHMQMSARVTEGYTADELRKRMGVTPRQMTIWIERGDLRRHATIGDRISHESVLRFVALHLDEIPLRRAEEWWIKSVIKDALASKAYFRRAA